MSTKLIDISEIEIKPVDSQCGGCKNTNSCASKTIGSSPQVAKVKSAMEMDF